MTYYRFYIEDTNTKKVYQGEGSTREEARENAIKKSNLKSSDTDDLSVISINEPNNIQLKESTMNNELKFEEITYKHKDADVYSLTATIPPKVKTITVKGYGSTLDEAKISAVIECKRMIKVYKECIEHIIDKI